MSSKADNTLLEEAPISKLFARYALPSIITMLFWGLQSIVDGLVVGNTIGSNGLGGVNIILPLFSGIFVLSLVISIGCQTLVSIGLGEENIEKARNAMSTGFWALLLITPIISLLLWRFSAEFTTLLGANARLFPHAHDYLKGFLFFIFPITLSFYNDAMLRAMGYPRLSMIIMSGSVILNILLTPIFIIYLEMGTYGAGLATALALTVGSAASSFIVFNPKEKISVQEGSFDFKLLWRAMYNGSSEGFTELATAAAIILINLVMVDFAGADGVAAFTAVNYINFVVVLIYFGISDGLIPVISHNYGARKLLRVNSIFDYAARINLIIGVLIFVLLQMFGPQFVQVFFSGDNPASVLAERGLALYSPVFLVLGLNMQITGFYTALGDARRSIIIAAMRSVVFLGFSVYVLTTYLGMEGVWISVPVAEFLTFLIAVRMYRHTRNRFSSEVAGR